MSETNLIAWLRRRIRQSAAVEVGPGDDAAVICLQPGSRAVVTTDAFLEGTHFAVADPAARVGHKVIAASVSDIAAMGCYPVASFVTVGLSRSRGNDFVMELAESMIAAAEHFAAPIAGGDVTSWDGGLSVTVTVLGETRGLEPVLRSGAKAGDALFVTGELGGSLLGRHLDAVPRIAEGVFLNTEIGVHAMMDISDGLSTDLHHLAEESGIGSVVRADAVPVSDAAREMAAADGRSPLDHALNDGEDFELLFTVPPDRADDLRSRWPFDVRLTQIGVVGGSDVLIEQPGGRREPLTRKGYEHRWK